jgi:hypothetical protein
VNIRRGHISPAEPTGELPVVPAGPAVNRASNGRFERDPDARRYPRSVRLTRAEDQELARRASQAGLSVSDYLRVRALA